MELDNLIGVLQNNFEGVSSFAEIDNPLSTNMLIDQIYEFTGIEPERADLFSAAEKLDFKFDRIGNEVFWLIRNVIKND